MSDDIPTGERVDERTGLWYAGCDTNAQFHLEGASTPEIPLSDGKVYIVQCCIAAEIEKTVGPFGDKETAEIVAKVLRDHFHNGGDRHVRIEKRVVL